tara:strand:+ start:2411 stop:3082 length:672 start_codon:yes stop_codon:yes gene_type:complete
MSDKQPKVSVIITCFNLENYISRAINSCINQTMSEDDYEIIVVDDCSTDGSLEIINGYGNLITQVVNLKNFGVAYSSNAGIKVAKGKYVVRVDGDDYINKSFLNTLTEFLDWNEDIGFVYCDHIVVEKDLSRKQEINTLEKLLDHGAGVMFRKKYLEAIGLYNEALRNREDYDLILRYIKNFNGHHVKLPYYRYFKRDGSLSTELESRESLRLLINEKENVKS